MANSDSTEEIIEENTASSDSTKPLRSSPCANHHQNAASSSATNNENDQHEEAPPPSFETIRNDLRLVNLAWKKYTAHMNAKIYVAGKEFKRLRNVGSTEKDFDELQKAIANLQIPWIPPQVNIVSPTKNKDKGSKPSWAANYMAKYFSSKPKLLENNHQNAASSSATTKKNPHGEALPPSSEMIPNDFRLMNSAWKKYMDQMNAKFSVASKEFKRLRRKYPDHMNAQINMASEEFKKTDFDKLQKAIKKLKSHVEEWQIPLTSDEDDHDGEDLSQTIGSELNLLVSAFEEAQKFMESTQGEINQARAKSNELQKANSEKQQKGESSKLRKDIGKLRVLIRSYGEIRSTDSNRHPYDWPDINGVGEGRMHFFFRESNEPNTEGVDGDKMMDKFKELTEPERFCLLCFFKFPPEEFIRRTTMIYLWIGIFRHLQEKYPSKEEKELLSLEEDAVKKIFDDLITKGFIERCSLEANSCKMSPSARSSLYKEAEANGFTSNDTLDLDAASLRGELIGHSCLINVGEAIIDCKPEIFESMEGIQSLYLGSWQTSATHHIELADTKILHGMSKLKNLTFLSLRGISLITELPKFISELNDLKILDLRTCHNLEVIPDEISSLKKLTHLDMSECYFLEHMPKSLAQLKKLEVLKGFFIGDSKNDKQSCTLSDLSKLPKLRKLNIYTSEEEFPTRSESSDLNALQEFPGLLKLTISWGGCSSPRKTADTAAPTAQEEGEKTLHLRLQKLDLQGFPLRRLPCWLQPWNLKELRKLYIRGGNLRDLGHLRENQGEHWNVEILRFKYLDALEIDWSKLMTLFPKLIYLHQKKCSKLNFQGDEISGWSEWKGEENSVWMHKQAIDTRFWLQKFCSSDVNSINLSSLLAYDPKIAQHNSNTSSRLETALLVN